MARIVFKPVTAKPFNKRAFTQEITRAQQQKTKPGLIKVFEQTVIGWSNPPFFKGVQTVKSSFISMFVFAAGSGAKYALVSLGARPHRIVPRKSPSLRFQTGYRAATQIGRLKSRAKIRSGQFVSSLGVNHPGFEGREFDELVAEAYLPTFEKDMQAATNRAAKRM